MIRKTNVEGIGFVRQGVLVNTAPTNEYAIKRDLARAKERKEKEAEERINSLETEVSDIKELLKQILQKVS